MSKYKPIIFIHFMIFLVFQKIYFKRKRNKEINKNKMGQGCVTSKQGSMLAKIKKNDRPKRPSACKKVLGNQKKLKNK